MEASDSRGPGIIGRSRQLRKSAADVRRRRQRIRRLALPVGNGRRWCRRCSRRRRFHGPVLPSSGGGGGSPEASALPTVRRSPIGGAVRVHGAAIQRRHQPSVDFLAAAQQLRRSQSSDDAVGVGRSQFPGRRFPLLHVGGRRPSTSVQPKRRRSDVVNPRPPTVIIISRENHIKSMTLNISNEFRSTVPATKNLRQRFLRNNG